MDNVGAIAYLADAEARLVRPVREAEAAAAGLPYFCIAREGGSQWRVTGHGHVGHDNAPRMPFLCRWLERDVLRLVDAEADVGGCYRVELHDSYSYLPRCPALTDSTASLWDNAMTFARPAGAREAAALLPDPYQIQGYGGTLEVVDEVPWAAKRPTLFFAGTTTGDRDPQRNARIRAAVWALGQPPDVARIRITQIAQMRAEHACAVVPRLRECLDRWVPLAEHHQYRYQVNLVGNTACWSRVPQALASHSVLLNVRHPDALWYYPLLREGTHLLAVDGLDELPRLRDELERGDPARPQRIADAANRFVDDFLRPHHAAIYTAHLLEACAWRGRR